MTYNNEFNLGALKLLNRGIVEKYQNRLNCSQDFKDWHAEKFKGKKGIDVQKELLEMGKYLNTTSDDFDLNPKQIKFIISEEDFNTAVKEYLIIE